MRALASLRLRLFLVSWIVFGTFFATNIVREHYPAFALVARGDFFLDDYAGFHADIYFHPVTKHWVVGNQVLGSLPAAVPLFLLDPALDALQRFEVAHGAARTQTAEYATDRPNRAAFFQKVRQDEQGSTLTAQRILNLREELFHFEHRNRRLRRS